jgi:hypothetical protein
MRRRLSQGTDVSHTAKISGMKPAGGPTSSVTGTLPEPTRCSIRGIRPASTLGAGRRPATVRSAIWEMRSRSKVCSWLTALVYGPKCFPQCRVEVAGRGWRSGHSGGTGVPPQRSWILRHYRERLKLSRDVVQAGQEISLSRTRTGCCALGGGPCQQVDCRIPEKYRRPLPRPTDSCSGAEPDRSPIRRSRFRGGPNGYGPFRNRPGRFSGPSGGGGLCFRQSYRIIGMCLCMSRDPPTP